MRFRRPVPQVSELKRILPLIPWLGALLVGALFPAALFALLQHSLRHFAPAFAVASLHAFVLGAPALLHYRATGGRRLLPVLVGGYLIGALPIGSIMVLGGDLRLSSSMMGPSLEMMTVAGAFGTLGALACWLTLRVFRQFS